MLVPSQGGRSNSIYSCCGLLDHTLAEVAQRDGHFFLNDCNDSLLCPHLMLRCTWLGKAVFIVMLLDSLPLTKQLNIKAINLQNSWLLLFLELAHCSVHSIFRGTSYILFSGIIFFIGLIA